jgi:hypothetical protein
MELKTVVAMLQGAVNGFGRPDSHVPIAGAQRGHNGGTHRGHTTWHFGNGFGRLGSHVLARGHNGSTQAQRGHNEGTLASDSGGPAAMY